MTIKKAFGLALREIRKKKRLTQLECSEALELTQAQWSSYELGKSSVTLDGVIAISAFLKLDPFILIMRSFDYLRYPDDKTLHLTVEDYQHILIEINNFRKKKLNAKLELLENFSKSLS